MGIFTYWTPVGNINMNPQVATVMKSYAPTSHLGTINAIYKYLTDSTYQL